MKLRLAGFHVRPPRPHEIPALRAFFPDDPLGAENILTLGAFAQPGDIPLGAAIVRPSKRGAVNIGHFLLFVRPEFRRQKIGSMLVRHLYPLALANQADHLILAELVHQDRPENAFYLSVGLSPERSFATYSLSISHGLATVCTPIVQRFSNSHPDLNDAEIITLDRLDPAQVARFFSVNHSGFVDQRLAQFQSGRYDLSLSTAAVRRGEIFAASLFRSKPGEPSIFLDLILTLNNIRNGPTPFILFAHTARIALEKGFTLCVFEADEMHDPFAVGFARRCAVKPQWHRYRYSIDRADMESLSGPSQT